MLCKKGCGFYSNKDGLCSSCYAKECDSKKDVKPNKKLKNRCFTCKKKVGINSFNCKCNQIFCSKHRYTFSHNCTFDHKEFNKQQIKLNNPIVKNDKVEKI